VRGTLSVYFSDVRISKQRREEKGMQPCDVGYALPSRDALHLCCQKAGSCLVRSHHRQAHRAVGCTRCCAMSAALARSSCKQGCGRCAYQLSERDHASSTCLNTNHKPLETNKHAGVATLSSLAVGGNGGVVLGHGKPIFRGAGATPNMYSMLPHKQNIVPPTRIQL
jgi:hypothetical protein